MRRPGVRRAFTIIELLVVIGIIAILASILLGSIALVKDQARKVKCAGNLKGWYRGLMAYATAPQNGGFLPCLASSGDSFYDRTPAMIKFFQDYDMDFRVAYSPSNPNLQAADDWTDFEWTVLEPDMAKALIIDNTGEFDSGVPVTFMANDEPPDTYTQVSGTWEELARTKPEDPYQGDKAHYSDTLGAKSTWAFDLRSTPGHGTLKLEAYIRKGPDGRTSAKYSDGTTSATICQYNATETYGWVTVGNFPVEGSAEPTFSVEAVEGGAAGPDIVWDGTAGKGLVAEADAASLTAGVTWTPITGANGKEYYSPIAAGNAAGSWNVTVPADYTGSLTLEAYFKVDSTGSNRGDVTYTVDGGQGITVSQKPQGSESTANWYWRTIGSFTLSGGTRTVTVAKAAGNNGRLWVGAIRLKGTLTPINYAPTAASETYTAVAGSTLTVQAAKGVLSNDTDPENDQLSAVPVSGVSHGTLTLNADGSFVYTPTAGYSGADSFTYKAKETRVGGLESGVVTATFNVTLPPACVLCADAIRLTGTLTNPTGGTGRVWADALRLTGSWYGGTSGPEPTGNEYRVLDGAWSLSTALPEPSRYGPNYQIGARDGATRRVAWYFKVPESKSYSVFGWWPADSSRATDAQFTIISPTGQQTVTVSQADTANNGDWRALGSAADFRSDVVSRVELSNAGSGSKAVVADAIAIVPNDSMPHSRAVIGYLFFGYREQIGGTMMTGQENIVLPSSAQEDNPGSVPLMADMYAPGAPAWTAHSDGVHILYMDGSVQWKSAGQTIPRWRDTFNQTFNW